MAGFELSTEGKSTAREPQNCYGSGAIGGSVFGNTLNLIFSVNEVVGSNLVFHAYTFGATGTITGATAFGSFLGGVALSDDSFTLPGTVYVECSAADHQFTFARQ